MPFRGVRGEEIVVPATVPNNESVVCPACGDTMYARGGDQRARHFYHNTPSGGGNCPTASNGESSTHARCVALAVAALQKQFDSQISHCGAEISLDVSTSGSGNRERRADALVEFDSENPFFGRGLIVEVQHQNEEKDIQKTTHDYLSIGYSVVWLSSNEFGEDQLDYSIVDEKFERDIKARHFDEREEYSAYSVRHNEARHFLVCSAYMYNGEHEWRTVPSYILTCEEEYEICIGRDCELRRMAEPDGTYTYIRDDEYAPNLPLKVLRNTIVREFETRSFREWAENKSIERLFATRPEVDRCCGPKGFHEWEERETLWEDSFDQSQIELHRCMHCAVRLVTNHRGRREHSTFCLYGREPDIEWDDVYFQADPVGCDHYLYDEDEIEDYCPKCGKTMQDE